MRIRLARTIGDLIYDHGHVPEKGIKLLIIGTVIPPVGEDR